VELLPGDEADVARIQHRDRKAFYDRVDRSAVGLLGFQRN